MCPRIPVAAVLLVLGMVSCAGPGSGSSGALVGRAAFMPQVANLAGGDVSLESLLRDRAAMEGEAPAYLLLVNSHSQCDVTPRFLKDLCGVWDDFVALKCRGACVLLEKEGAPAEKWKGYARPHFLVCRDPGGRCMDFYVKETMPALTLVDRTGSVVFHCEGYLAPVTLAHKIKSADFQEVKTTSG